MSDEARTDGDNVRLPPEAPQQRPVSPQEASQIVREIHQLIRAGNAQSAWQSIQHLHPADIGSILGGLPRTSRHAMVRVMTPQTITSILRQMHPVEASRVGTRLGSQLLSSVLSQVQPREALETLRRLHTKPAQEVAQNLDPSVELPDTLTHAQDTAGALMVTRVPAVNLDADIRAAKESLREQGEDRYKFTHVLVLDGDRLAGHASLVDIALAEDGTPIQSVTSPVLVTVDVDTSADECARLRRHYDLTQIPVVDGDELLGVVLAESLLKATVDQDTRQMLRVANVGGESADGPLTNSIRARLPWLTVNLGTTFVSAATISLFESTLAQVVALAAFLPVIAGQGGIGGTQTLTLIIRAMALGELVGIGALRLLLREAAIGALHGLWLGVLVAVIAIAWQQNLGLALVLGIAMFGNMALAGPVGAGIPLLLRRIGIDPALASAVIVTTFTDVVGFLLFLGIATSAISLIQ